MASASPAPKLAIKDSIPTPPPRASFLDLPLELRFRVSHYLTQDRLIKLWKSPQSKWPWSHHNTSPLLALSLTSKQLQSEVTTWRKTARSVHSVNFAGHFDPDTTVFTLDYRNMLLAPSYDPFFHAGPFFNAWWNTVFQEHAQHVFVDFEMCVDQSMDIRAVLAPLRHLRGLKRIDMGVRGWLNNWTRFWLLREVCGALGGVTYYRGECEVCDEAAPVVRWRDLEWAEGGSWRVLPRLKREQWLCVFWGVAAGVTGEEVEELNEVRDAFTYDGMSMEPCFEEWTGGGGVIRREVLKGSSLAGNIGEVNELNRGDDEEDEEEEEEADEADETAEHSQNGSSSNPYISEPFGPSLPPFPDEGYGSQSGDAYQVEDYNSQHENAVTGLHTYPFGWRLMSLPYRGLELR